MNRPTDTLAKRLGMTVHVSPLLLKARFLGLANASDLCTLAVQRGCRHYASGDELHEEPPQSKTFTHEELAVALLHPSLDYDPHAIRCGAAMLGATGNRPKAIARLAKQERAESVVRYVAECGSRYEPDNSFWKALLELISKKPVTRDDVLPHATRFVAMSGYVRGVGTKLVTEWQRPAPRKLAA